MTAPARPTAKGWTPDDSTFGARLALVRQRMGWGNVREAALQCGVPPESWRTWERDGVVPRRVVEIAALIADRTGCDYGWLLAGARLQGGTAESGVKEPQIETGRPTEVGMIHQLSPRSNGGGQRQRRTRPPSTPRTNTTRPGGARPALLPRSA